MRDFNDSLFIALVWDIDNNEVNAEAHFEVIHEDGSIIHKQLLFIKKQFIRNL